LRIIIERVDPEEIIRQIVGNIPYQVRKSGSRVEIEIEDTNAKALNVVRTTLRDRIKRKLPRGWKVRIEE